MIIITAFSLRLTTDLKPIFVPVSDEVQMKMFISNQNLIYTAISGVIFLNRYSRNDKRIVYFALTKDEARFNLETGSHPENSF